MVIYLLNKLKQEKDLPVMQEIDNVFHLDKKFSLNLSLSQSPIPLDSGGWVLILQGLD